MGKISINLTLHVGKFKIQYRLRVSEEDLRRFAEVCSECDPNDLQGVKERFARTLEEVIDRFISKAYRGTDTADKILARTLVYLATELVLVDEALKNAEGGRIL